MRLPDHRGFWDARASRQDEREERASRKRVHTDLHWEEIERRLDGVQRILDADGGTGRFSIPLAERGFEVVHLDLAPEMLRLARQKAAVRGLANITFVEGTVTDLSRFADGEFDLVLSLDAPLSFAYPQHKRALDELVRVTKHTLIISVMNRLGHLPLWVSGDITVLGEFHTAHRLLREGVFELDERVYSAYPQMIPDVYFFHPDEIQALLRARGCEIVHISAPGGLARLVSDEAMEKIIADEKLYHQFLELERVYSRSPYALAVGHRTAGNLLVTARKLKPTEP